MEDEVLSNLLDTLCSMKDAERKANQIRPIVPIEEWIEDPYYCGPDASDIYPFWKKHIIAIFNSPVLINELILTRKFRYSVKLL